MYDNSFLPKPFLIFLELIIVTIFFIPLFTFLLGDQSCECVSLEHIQLETIADFHGTVKV